MRTYKTWTEKEDNYLKESYLNNQHINIAIYLHRTLSSIRNRISKLKLKPSWHPIKYWKGKKRDKETMRKLQEGRKKYFDIYGHPFHGKHHLPETRIKISERTKGHKSHNKKYPDFWKCKICFREFKHVGHKRQFCSKNCVIVAQKKGIINGGQFRKGSFHPYWRDGKSIEPYPIYWTQVLKRSIRERNNYTCQLCFGYGKEVHHKDYNKENCSLDNLITLCKKCHTKTNFNRNGWILFFSENLSQISTKNTNLI